MLELSQQSPKESAFEASVLPHLSAAYNLARWLVRREDDARDVVQESYLRAWRSFDTFHGGDARAWVLTIVRNSAHTFLRRDASRRRLVAGDAPFDEEVHATETVEPPDAAILRQADAATIRAAIDELPVELREVIVLRELEGLSYKEIAQIAQIPLGTVMSRLSRARRALFEVLSAPPRGPASATKESLA